MINIRHKLGEQANPLLILFLYVDSEFCLTLAMRASVAVCHYYLN